ncbi:MAG: peptidylprolyl isomerase [Chthonomonadaceae bacterium]|nr:peptidylprolyl isomerase [Chthonomonadaceae bacterium]
MTQLLLALVFVPVRASGPEIAMSVVGRGKVIIELYPTEAPKLVKHVLGLVERKFYDGMLIHRKVDNFVIQTGDPKSKNVSVSYARKHKGKYGEVPGLGEAGSGQSVAYEINELKHEKYAVGMALESPMDDSGDSQFFINLKDNFRLNGMYEVFGKVMKGQSVIDKIQRGDRITSIRRIR